MAKRKEGFVFSLDAFVAFVLIMININFLIYIMSFPKSYHDELEAAHILAHDTLTVLATSKEKGYSSTYLERLIAREDVEIIMRRIAGGDPSYRSIIPPGYGYRLEVAGVESNDWDVIYDSGADVHSDRYGKRYTKLQAVAFVFMPIYEIPPSPGESPFCHYGCFGYQSPGQYAKPCDKTPCDSPKSNFIAGKNTISKVRLVVYT